MISWLWANTWIYGECVNVFLINFIVLSSPCDFQLLVECFFFFWVSKIQKTNLPFSRVPLVVCVLICESTSSHRGRDQGFFQRINLRKKVQVCHVVVTSKPHYSVLWQLVCALTLISSSSNAPLDATRDNDWTCPKCGNINFSFRTVCNMRKCNTPKPGSQVCASLFLMNLKLISLNSVFAWDGSPVSYLINLSYHFVNVWYCTW